MKFQKTLAVAAGATLVAAIAGAMAPSSSSSSTATPVAGTVKGKVTFEGERPTIKPLTISEEQAKGCCEPGMSVDSTNRELLISEKGGLANVVVMIEVDGKEVEAMENPIELDQAKCRFEPHVLAFPAGTTVHYLNSDAISHNVHTYSTKNGSMNQTVSAGSSLEQVLEKSEVVKVTCDIHPWMLSYIYVTETNFYAVTDAEGNFEIAGLPPGEYKVEMWHEKLGKAKAEVVVKEDGSSEPLEVQMGGEDKGGGRGRRRR